jgi:hypothetical protein
MKLTEEIIKSLCSCNNWMCEKPHTIRDLEQELGEKVETKSKKEEVYCPDCEKIVLAWIGPEQTPYCITCSKRVEKPIARSATVKCPKCEQAVMEMCVYNYGDPPNEKEEAYCDKCNTTFETKTGAIVDEVVDDKSSVESPVVKHEMYYDGQIYTCAQCTFETYFTQEVYEHENGSVSIKKEETKKEELHYCVSKLGQAGKFICKYCPAEFDTFALAMAHETSAGKKANQSTGYTYKEHCKHEPHTVIVGAKLEESDLTPELKNKGFKVGDHSWEIAAGRKWDCENKLNDFDLVLNLSGTKLAKTSHDIPIKELKKWENYVSDSEPSFREIALNWPDRGTVSLPSGWWKDLLKHIQNKHLKMLVFCIGGHGRTGTAVASMLVVGLGWEPKKACEWVWKHYCDEAIETEKQVDYVYRMAGQKYVAPKKETGTGTSNSSTRESGTTSLF